MLEWHSEETSVSAFDGILYRILYFVLLLLVVFGKIPLKTPQHWKFLENVHSCPQFKPLWLCKFLPKNILIKYILKKNKKTTALSLAKTFFSPINLTWRREREFRGAAHHPKLSLAKTTCGAASPHSAYTVSFLESGPLYNPPWTTLGPAGFFKHATGQDFLAISQNRDWREKKRLFFFVLSSLPLSLWIPTETKTHAGEWGLRFWKECQSEAEFP